MNPGGVMCSVTPVFNPAVQYSWNLLELGDPQSSREKENFFFLSVRWWTFFCFAYIFLIATHLLYTIVEMMDSNKTDFDHFTI